MANHRFQEYATSGAFTLGLTRNQVSTLDMIERGSHLAAPSALKRGTSTMSDQSPPIREPEISREAVKHLVRKAIEDAQDSAIPEPWEVAEHHAGIAADAILNLAPVGGRGEGWRPIDTAPKDEAVLVAGGDAHYPVTANWTGRNDEPWRIDGQSDVHAEIGWPTHWQPLPPPPQDQHQGGTDALR